MDSTDGVVKVSGDGATDDDVTFSECWNGFLVTHGLDQWTCGSPEAFRHLLESFPKGTVVLVQLFNGSGDQSLTKKENRRPSPDKVRSRIKDAT